MRRPLSNGWRPRQHDLYLGTFLSTDCGKVSVSVDGVATTYDLYLNEYGGTTANLKVRGGVAAGNHNVEITATFTKNAASSAKDRCGKRFRLWIWRSTTSNNSERRPSITFR